MRSVPVCPPPSVGNEPARGEAEGKLVEAPCAEVPQLGEETSEDGRVTEVHSVAWILPLGFYLLSSLIA
ncbi:hypothetical protein AV530_001332 [Patagioenas fasciata monilis]|uniref:Uncharacterized protein n=1 Tax=Patagioenas fasciata monilis TaxID=372326 RepID=A0A1V4JRX7_PATFA|nr:hypothetical protein AV530_001332 [Patagioenas fasciata monilis]